MRINLCLLLFLLLLNNSCNFRHKEKKGDTKQDTYVNPLFTEGPNPNAIYHDGKYYMLIRNDTYLNISPCR